MELLERELRVDGERPEVPAFRTEILGHELDELGLGRVRQSLQQRPASRIVEWPREQLVDSLVGDLRQVAALLRRVREHLRTIEVACRELRRTRWIDVGDLGFVPMRDAES